MVTGGRIVHHLKAFAPDPKILYCLQAFKPHTRGVAMLAGGESIKIIHGQYVPVRANVEYLPNLSAHADYSEIIAWLGGFESAPKKTFITHGEPVATDTMRLHIEEELRWKTIVPDYLETVTLD